MFAFPCAERERDTSRLVLRLLILGLGVARRALPDPLCDLRAVRFGFVIIYILLTFFTKDSMQIDNRMTVLLVESCIL